jgi:hypothetical protein
MHHGDIQHSGIADALCADLERYPDHSLLGIAIFSLCVGRLRHLFVRSSNSNAAEKAQHKTACDIGESPRNGFSPYWLDIDVG